MNEIHFSKERETIDPEARKEARVFEVMEKNHKVAIAALKLENRLAEAKSVEEVDSLRNDTEFFAGLPPQVIDPLTRVVRNYYYRLHQTLSVEAKMQELAELLAGFGQEPEDLPAFIGEYVYKNETNLGRPVGKVRLSAQEGFVTLFFSSSQDYENFIKRDLSSRSEQTEQVEYLAANSGGCYVHHEELKSLLAGSVTYLGPILLINGDEQDKKSTLMHERQHYINNAILNSFGGLKPLRPRALLEGGPVPARQEKDYIDEGIKDEVLAFLRGGNFNDFGRFQGLVTNKLYAHLFEKLSPIQLSEVKTALEAVDTFVQEKHELLRSPTARAVLVYQLIGVSLEKFPLWLTEIEKHLASRFEELGRFDEVYKMGLESSENPVDFEMLIGLHGASGGSYPADFPETLADFGEKVRGLLKEMKKIFWKASASATDLSRLNSQHEKEAAELLLHYRQKKQELDENLSLISFGEVVAPLASDSRIYEYGEADYDTVNRETASTVHIRDTVLGVAGQLSAAEVVEIREYALEHLSSGQDKRRSKVFRRFSENIKQAVYKLNDSRAVWVYISDATPHSRHVSLTVEYVCDKTDRKQGLKGVKFELVLTAPWGGPLQAKVGENKQFI